jgi:hypothetical protein
MVPNLHIDAERFVCRRAAMRDQCEPLAGLGGRGKVDEDGETFRRWRDHYRSAGAR